MGGPAENRTGQSFLGWLLRLPFQGSTWRRTLYAIISPLVGVCLLVVAVFGGHRTAARVRRQLAVSLLDASPGRAAPTWPRVVGHGLVSLPFDILAAVFAGYGWAIVVLNIAYPIRLLAEPDVATLTAGAWGGPSLAGAWLVHALGGLVALWLVPLLVVALTRVQSTLASVLLWPPAQPATLRGARTQ
ncbi:hypothetical protein [Thermobifida cellulosilytica]|uniref:hypothetical protein n=1 Tax=Thermobifida cellulosilytica TaxID=144786 RepID=UPI000A739AD4|nr:hypothetical protein [Thermobifida cellulosilytica]